MTLRPCLTCGLPSAGPRCPEHTTDPKGTPEARGYNAAWRKLSKRARRLQPWCECGAVDDLQLDHLPRHGNARPKASPSAWASTR